MGMVAFVLMVSPVTGAAGDGRAGASTRGVLLAQASPDPAPAPAPSEGSENVRFEVRRYKVEGNTLLSQAVLDRAVNPYIGKSKDFGDVQKALEAQGLYPVANPPAEFAAQIKRETATWARIIKDTGIKPE